LIGESAIVNEMQRFIFFRAAFGIRDTDTPRDYSARLNGANYEPRNSPFRVIRGNADARPACAVTHALKRPARADYRQHSRFGFGRAANSSRIDVFHDRDFRADNESNRIAKSRVHRSHPSSPPPALVYDRKEN